MEGLKRFGQLETNPLKCSMGQKMLMLLFSIGDSGLLYIFYLFYFLYSLFLTFYLAVLLVPL